MDENNKTHSLLARLKQRAAQRSTGKPLEASVATKDCPNCGAGRAEQDGLTHCAYCGYEFISVKLDDGIYIQSSDNSK